MSENQQLSKIIQHLQDAPCLQDDFVNFIFNTLRNMSLSLLPLLAASIEVKHPQGDSEVLVWLTALVLSVTSLALLALSNFYACRQISKLNIPRWAGVTTAVFFIYWLAVCFYLLAQYNILRS